MLIVIRRFCLRTPFLLCQYPCGLFSFTSSPSMQQDMKEYRFNHSAVFSSHKSSKENSTEVGKAKTGKLWNLHRQYRRPFQPQQTFANRVQTSLVLSHSYGWNLLSPVSFTWTSERRGWIKARAVKKLPLKSWRARKIILQLPVEWYVMDKSPMAVSYHWSLTLSPFTSAGVAQFKQSTSIYQVSTD